MPHLTDEQQRAAESIETNVLVSAGAGSGKTMVLVERFIQVLRSNPEAGVGDVVAVTFTRKAAEEMRSRLKARLREITLDTSAEEKQRWLKLLADVDRARIGTIHSLCESILKTFPAEAAVDPQFEILDDLTRAKIINECVESALQTLICEPQADDLILLEFPIESIRKWVLGRLEQIPQYRDSRRQLGAGCEQLTTIAATVINRVRRLELERLLSDGQLERSFHMLSDNPWPDHENKLEIVRAQIVSHLEKLFRIRREQPDDLKDCAICIGELSEVPSPGTAGGPKGKPLRAAISEIRARAKKFADNCPIELNEADEQGFAVVRALVKVVDRAIQEYESRKLELQKLDYNDLVAKTHSLLCSDSESSVRARKQFGDQLYAVLVDEFQDTNHTQAQLLSAICGKRSRLFLIGDDKQSIYKFQGADVSTFNEWKTLMKTGSHQLAGESILLDLSYSFRSHPAIVNFVNRFFHFHFSHDAGESHAAHKAKHRALSASRTDSHDPQRVDVIVYDSVSGEQKRQTERARFIESKAIAAWILEKIGSNATIYDKATKSDRPLTFGDFAVLVQANDDFSAIESALADAGVPYVTYAGSGFLNRQEILDLENMLRWLSCPEDDHALIAVLRSPFYGINDGIIHKLYMEGQHSLWQSLQRASKSEDFAILRPIIASLKEFHALTEQLSLSDLLRHLILNSSYDVISLSQPNGRQKSRNVWKFITFAREYNHLPLSEFLAALETMRALGVTKQTDAPLNAEDSVKLMTIHKSKGLEFPAVVLPVMGKKVHLFTPKLLLHRDFGISFDTSRSSDEARPAYFKASLAINNELDAEERKRLLYVAMTRARDFLGVFIEQNARNEISFRLWVKEALGLDAENDDDSSSVRHSQLTVGEDYQIRYFDDLGVDQWELAGRGLAGKYVPSHDVEALSREIGFDLLKPLHEEFAAEIPGKRIHWHRAERVTVSEKQPSIHPTVVGNLFHAVMQHTINCKSPADRQLISRLALSNGVHAIDPTLHEKLIARVLNFLNAYEESSLKEIIDTSTRVLCEVNYTAVANQSDFDKRPDLILQDATGAWLIIDFKTDHMSSQDIPAKLNQHSPQVLQYVRDFEAITGVRATGWLYFADLGRLEALETQSYTVGKKGQLRLPIPT